MQAHRDFVDPKLNARLGRLTLEARSLMVGSFTGRHKSPHRGSSVDFSQYRKYVPGDEIRHIDWRVYGRSERFYVKEFEADTNLRCHLVLDCSASMRFQGKSGRKIDYARRLVAALAHVLLNQGDGVGLAAFNDKLVHDIPARTSPRHLNAVMEILGKIEPQGNTDLVKQLDDLAGRVRNRALIIIISDLFHDVEELGKTFSHFSFRKHDLAVFHIVDRAEIEFPFDKPTRFVGIEGGDSVDADPEAIRQDYLREFGQYLQDIRATSLRNKADYRLAVTDQDLEALISNFLLDRMNRRG
jgi:uncharacterized protein (DUF58 family)